MHQNSHNISPQTRAKIGRAGALKRYHGATDPQTLDAVRDANAARIADYATAILNTSPPLTPEQIRGLSQLIATGGEAR